MHVTRAADATPLVHFGVLSGEHRFIAPRENRPACFSVAYNEAENTIFRMKRLKIREVTQYSLCARYRNKDTCRASWAVHDKGTGLCAVS